ncbi:MAG: PTS sugar transporter subunit IIC [Breznakia sp.]
MNSLLNFIENRVAGPMAKLAEQHHLKSVKDGMMVSVPFTIIGSIFILIGNLPIAAWKEFVMPYQAMLGTISTVTMGILALLAAGTVAYFSAKHYKDVNLNPIMVSLVSISAFLLTTLNEEYVLNTSLFGTRGVFTAIVIALISASITRFFVKRNLVIRFPDSVPPMVSSSFMNLVPAAVILILIWIVRIVLGFDINELLTSIFSPLVFGLNTLPGFLIFMLIRSLLWSVGIHGGAILSVADPIFLTMFGENLAAFNAGTLPPFITAQGFTMFVFLGGGGATLPLVFMMMRSKEKGFKALGRLSLPGSVFEINEPVVFGVPLVLNPMMIIPYVASNLLLSGITYLLMLLQIIGRPVVSIPWTMPPILSHYLVTGGDIRAAIWGVISLLLAGAIYYPFFKMMERERLAIEQKNNGGINE